MMALHQSFLVHLHHVEAAFGCAARMARGRLASGWC